MNASTTTDADLSNTTAFTPWTYHTPALETQVAILLWKIWPPCLLVLGGFGNVATVCVMRRIKDNHSSQHIFLMALAVSDFTLLYVSVLRQWLYFLFRVDMYDVHDVICKVSWWLIYVVSNTSSWLLTCLTVQRTMAVTWPHKMRMFCTKQRTWAVVATISCSACVVHSHFMFGMKISAGGMCTFGSEQYKDFITRVWAWEELAIFTLIPSFCLLICDVILSWTLFKSSSLMSSSSSSTSTNAISSGVNTTRRKTASRTTVMILALSLTFLVLTLPVCVYLVWDYYAFYADAEDTETPRLWTRPGLAFAVTMLLWYTNSAVNFLLYCFTGTRFRKEFLTWICCWDQTPFKVSATQSSSRFSSQAKEK